MKIFKIILNTKKDQFKILLKKFKFLKKKINKIDYKPFDSVH